jgi:hypothetical protein
MNLMDDGRTRLIAKFLFRARGVLDIYVHLYSANMKLDELKRIAEPKYEVVRNDNGELVQRLVPREVARQRRQLEQRAVKARIHTLTKMFALNSKRPIVEITPEFVKAVSPLVAKPRKYAIDLCRNLLRLETYGLRPWSDISGQVTPSKRFAAAKRVAAQLDILETHGAIERFGAVRIIETTLPEMMKSKCPSDLADLLECGIDTLRKFATEAHVMRPAKGKRDFQYSPSSIKSIVHYASEHAGTQRTRRIAAMLLEDLHKYENDQKGMRDTK